MNEKTVMLCYDQAPPTSNKNNGIGGRGHPLAIARTKKRWSEIWGAELMRARVPRGCSFIRATALIEYATKGKRDSDNLYFPISKPLADTCVRMGLIEDDDPGHYAFERPVISLGVDGLNRLTKSRTTIMLHYTKEA